MFFFLFGKKTGLEEMFVLVLLFLLFEKEKAMNFGSVYLLGYLNLLFFFFSLI